MKLNKYVLFCWLSIFLSYLCQAQPLYNNLYNYGGLQEFNAEIHLINGVNLIEMGSALSLENKRGIIIREIDETGTLLWEDFITNDSLNLHINWTHTNFIKNDILYVFAGAQKVVNGNPIFSWPYFLKYNLNEKKVLNLKFYPFDKIGIILTSIYHKDGYIYGGGYQGDDSKDLLIMKLDTSGKLIWQKNISYNEHEELLEIESFGNDLVISGFYTDFRERVSLIYLAKLDTNGQVIKKVNPTIFGSTGTMQTEIIDDRIYFITTSDETLEVYDTQYLGEFNANLEVVWDTLIPQTSRYNINFRRIEVLNNEIIIAGNIKNAREFTNNKIWSYATSWSLEGQFNWEHVYQYDPTFTHHIDDIEAAPNGDLIFMGTVFDRSDQYLWLFRTDSQGCGTVQDTCYYTLDAYFGLDTMVSVFETIRPNFNLVEVLGNPFKEQLLLNSYSHQNFDVLIYDVQGKQVYEGVLGSNLKLNTANWQSGVYVMRVMDESKLINVVKLIRE